MERQYSFEKMESIQFKTTCIQEFDDMKNGGASYRLTGKQLSGLPQDFEDMDILRVKLDTYYYDRLDGKEAKLEERCQITSDLFHKYLRVRGGRRITYENLAKFCVGARLSVKEADELFRYRGRRLDPENKSDYILMCELENGGDFSEYQKDMLKYAQYIVKGLPEG